jgi:hypothetical protein
MNKATANQMRLRFVVELGRGLAIVWPVLSVILLLIVILGFFSARLEHWPFGDGLYFALITGFTIGYGDFVPHQPLVRLFAVCLAFLGIMLTAIIAAVAVKALNAATSSKE